MATDRVYQGGCHCGRIRFEIAGTSIASQLQLFDLR
jgi:hypothetical protein